MTDDKVTEAVDKLLGLKTFEVFATETVYYAKKIQAYTLEEVYSLVDSGQVEFTNEDMYDGDNFSFDEVKEVTDESNQNDHDH